MYYPPAKFGDGMFSGVLECRRTQYTHHIHTYVRADARSTPATMSA